MKWLIGLLTLLCLTARAQYITRLQLVPLSNYVLYVDNRLITASNVFEVYFESLTNVGAGLHWDGAQLSATGAVVAGVTVTGVYTNGQVLGMSVTNLDFRTNIDIVWTGTLSSSTAILTPALRSTTGSGAIVRSNAAAMNNLTVNNSLNLPSLTANSLLRLSGFGSVAAAVIGTGLSFDGTTLAASNVVTTNGVSSGIGAIGVTNNFDILWLAVSNANRITLNATVQNTTGRGSLVRSNAPTVSNPSVLSGYTNVVDTIFMSANRAVSSGYHVLTNRTLDADGNIGVDHWQVFNYPEVSIGLNLYDYGADAMSQVYSMGSLNSVFDIWPNTTLHSNVVLNNVTASSMLRTDSQKRITNAVIGSGLAFDGTTLSASTTGDFHSIVTNNVLAGYLIKTLFTTNSFDIAWMVRSNNETSVTVSLYATNTTGSGGLVRSNAPSLNNLKLLNVTPSSIVRVDASSVVAPVTIGTGLTFDGTTLSAPSAGTLGLSSNGVSAFETVGRMDFTNSFDLGWSIVSNATYAAVGGYITNTTGTGALVRSNTPTLFNAALKNSNGRETTITNVDFAGLASPTLRFDADSALTTGSRIRYAIKGGVNWEQSAASNTMTLISYEAPFTGPLHVWDINKTERSIVFGANNPDGWNIFTNKTDFYSPSNCVLGHQAMNTNATRNFVYLPTMTNAPLATPTAIQTFAPMVVDTNNAKVWIYVGGTWKYLQLN